MLNDPIVVVDRVTSMSARYEGVSSRMILFEELVPCVANHDALCRARAVTLETDPAYILFTSGSTGVPKGVAISHRAVLSFIEAFLEVTGIGEGDRIGNQAPFDFDVSTKDIYSSLATGATLVIIPRELFMKPAALMNYLSTQRITVLIWAVAALCIVSSYHALKSASLPNLRIVGFSGEVFPRKHLNAWRTALPRATFINLYGPTEITCNCLYHTLDPRRGYEEGIPLGTPFPHCRVNVVDERGNEVACGQEPGEIIVGGPSLALGYVGMPDETSRAFVQSPLSGGVPSTVYRTGDLAAYDQNGELYFKGRKDNQIKYQGHRIELEEVDSAIEEVPGVQRCRCVYDQRRKRLLAYYEGAVGERELAVLVSGLLPQHMRPHALRKVEGMPLNKNGKVDRLQLLELRTYDDAK